MAKKYFKVNDIDKQILDASLDYCLQNNTPSFSNLNDTYNYFKREQARNDLEIHTPVLGYSGGHEPLNVIRRDLSVYRKIISEGINESL